MKLGYIKYIANEESSKLITDLENEGVEKIIIEVNAKEGHVQETLLESIRTLHEYDTLVINRLDDLGETISDIINVLKKLEARNIKMQIIESPFSSEIMEDEQIDRLLQRQLLEVLIWVENKEKRDIERRQSRAVEMIKATKSKKGSGRPIKYSKDAENIKDREIYYHVVNMLKNDIPIKRISDTLNIGRNAIYRIKSEIESEKHTD